VVGVSLADAGEAAVFTDRSEFVASIDVVAEQTFSGVFAPGVTFGSRNFGFAASFPPFVFRGSDGVPILAFTAEFHSGPDTSLAAGHTPATDEFLLVELDALYESFGLDLLVRGTPATGASVYRLTLLRGGDAVWEGESAADAFVGVTLPGGFDAVRVVGVQAGGAAAAIEVVDNVVVGGRVPEGCNAADLADPRGLLDLADITAFVDAFVDMSDAADLSTDGLLDLADITAFVGAFVGGCP
jgi:hypothetical protein